MSTPDREPLEIEHLLTEDQRRTITVEDQLRFRESLARPTDHFDEIDEAIDDHLQVDPFNGDPPSRRSDRELGRVLSILDSLDAERGTHE